MKVIQDLEPLRSCRRPIVLAAGFFDGVHIGHVRILDATRDRARKCKGEAWVRTFDTHPLKVLRPAAAPLLLTSTAHKIALLRQVGMDGCVLLPFTPALAAQDPSAFAQWLLESARTLLAVVVGENWRFGAGATGTPVMLADRAARDGIGVMTIPPVRHHDDVVSSTRIRKAVTHGDLETAAAMLGRPPSVLGTVVHGREIGRQMGYPSANLYPHNEALPPLGVYAVEARVGSRFYQGVLNFGTRPTFDRDQAVPPLMELHLLDFSGCLYDQDIEAFFIHRIRDEWYFASIEELKAQIADDVIRARRILSDKGLAPDARRKGLPGWMKGPGMVGDTELESVTSCV